MKKEVKQNSNKKLRVANLSSGQTNGLNSSLVFTPVQVSLVPIFSAHDALVSFVGPVNAACPQGVRGGPEGHPSFLPFPRCPV